MSSDNLNRKSTNVVLQNTSVTRKLRELDLGHSSVIVWFTGLSGSGKSTIAHAVEEYLHKEGYRTFVLDGDNVRHGLCGDLGFSKKDRQENVRRIGEVAKLFMEAGFIVFVALISPYRKDRDLVRKAVDVGDFFEVFCEASIEACEERDVKGFYKKALTGELADFTGVSSPYEEPLNPDLTLNTEALSLNVCVQEVIALIKSNCIYKFRKDGYLDE